MLPFADAGGGLIEHVDRYAPLLAMRGNRSETVRLGDTEEGNFTDLKSISVGEASEAKNKEVNNIVDSNESRKETQLEMFFRQWENWCGLFFQDPYSKKDIIECIMEKEATKIPVDEYEHNDLYFDPEYGELAYRIYDIMYDEPKDSAQTISPRSIAPESQTKSDALNFVLKRYDPEQYKSAWIDHYGKIGVAKAAKITGLDRKKLGRWFRESKKKKY